MIRPFEDERAIASSAIDDYHCAITIRHRLAAMKSGSKKSTPSFVEKHSRYLVACALLLIILLIAFVRLRLIAAPLERDEGEYAYAGQLILRGFPPYLHAFNMKFPGVYGAYALIIALLGETATGIRTGLLIVNAVTILFVFLLARRLIGNYSALVAAAVFAFLSLGQPVMGPFAHATHFVILFAAAGALLLLRAMDTDRAAWIFASGAAMGCAMLMKQHGALFILFALVYLIWDEYRIRRSTLRRLAFKVSLLSIGAAMPLIATLIALARGGVLGKFWFWTFTYAGEYVSQLPLSAGASIFFNRAGDVASPSWLLWAMAAMGAVALWRNEQTANSKVFIYGFFAASFLAMVPGFYFRPHYFILILPATALLAAVALNHLNALLIRRHLHRAALIASPALLAVALLFCAIKQGAFLFTLEAQEAVRAVYGKNPFPESVEVARYIRSNSDESDRIAVLGSEPQIYFYSDRVSATGHIYMYGLMEPHDYAEQMQREMIAEIEASRPKFLVQVSTPESWLRQPSSASLLFDWMGKYIKQDFDLVGVAETASTGATRYYWDEETRRYSSRSLPAMLVFRRKAAAGE